MIGTIFDIKEFSMHDGPGSRVTVFLKGCPLSCLWCHNPEGLSAETQLMYKKNLCTNCGSCRKQCEHDECKKAGRCIFACPNGCLSMCGKKCSSDELCKKLLKYKDFIEVSGGGITISGGEPLLQADFVCELAEKLSGIHLALQTSGYADRETYRRVVGRFDYIMQDIKIADNDKHKFYTGVGNEKILKNIEYLKKSNKDFVFRVPLIPNITDTDENLAAIAEIAGENRVELLPYNSMAGAKYDMVGLKYCLECETEDKRKNYTEFFANAIIR